MKKASVFELTAWLQESVMAWDYEAKGGDIQAGLHIWCSNHVYAWVCLENACKFVWRKCASVSTLTPRHLLWDVLTWMINSDGVNPISLGIKRISPEEPWAPKGGLINCILCSIPSQRWAGPSSDGAFETFRLKLGQRALLCNRIEKLSYSSSIRQDHDSLSDQLKRWVPRWAPGTRTRADSKLYGPVTNLPGSVVRCPPPRRHAQDAKAIEVTSWHAVNWRYSHTKITIPGYFSF